MSLQKEIKYAINSTVGTPAFESLSEMMCPDGVKFTASYNSIYYNFGDGPTNKKLIAFGVGSISVFADKRYSTTSSPSMLKVYKNGQLYKTEVVGVPNSITRWYCTLENISLGDEIEIIYTGDGVLKIGAEVVKEDHRFKIES
jgi:hypothetical protein